MAESRRSVVTCAPGPGWELLPPPASLRGGPADPVTVLVGRTGKLEPIARFELMPAGGSRRGEAQGPVSVAVRVEDERPTVVVAHHLSGALTVHRGRDEASPGSRHGTRQARLYEVPLLPSPSGSRRGAARAIARIVVLRSLETFVDRSLPGLSLAMEEASWRLRGLAEGPVAVTADGLRSGRLGRIAGAFPFAPRPARNLLLLHGSFSSTASAFADLVQGGFLPAATAVYEDRIFGFEHFTLGRTPEENAVALLARLDPSVDAVVDVLTHSRGGLVLRTLAERGSALGLRPGPLRLGRAVLAASPSAGTPLATPRHWDRTLGWLLNLLDMFPKIPLALLLDLVVEGLVWMAHRIGGAVPGIAAMDSEGETLRALAGGESTGEALRPEAYFGLVARFAAPISIAGRLSELGIDSFFGEPHDLVVPTLGGLALGSAPGAVIEEQHAALYGPGGRLGAADRDPVHHLNLFGRPRSTSFLLAALAGEPYALWGREEQARRGRAIATPPPRALLGAACHEAFELTVLPGDSAASSALLLARWGAARVVERFERKGVRWRSIIAGQERIRAAIEGRPGARPMPSARELERFGTLLFETLLPGEARRLYDVGRARSEGGRLDLVFTSTIDWVADKPWELAFDPTRRSFLALEDVNFVRNVITAVPAEQVEGRSGALSILVAGAQPEAADHLAFDEELQAIRDALGPLVAEGLARVETRPGLTVEGLRSALDQGGLDVVHFVGHGSYDDRTRAGSLLLEDGSPAGRWVDADTLRAIVSGRGLRLVVLNACESGRGSRSDFNRGVAPALVAGGVPAVVANQYSVLDSSAVTFSRELYRGLARGRSLGDAAREARLAVRTSSGADSVGWGTPVVFARDPAGVLRQPPAHGTKGHRA